MKEIIVAKASPIGDQVIESVAIRIETGVPDFGHDRDFVTQAQAFYDAEADKVVDALWTALPGGVIDRVLAKLLERHASLFKIPHSGGSND